MPNMPRSASKTRHQPRVTVFIPVYNVGRYIGEAIESVLAQTFSDFEVLIIDDGSTDSGPSIIQKYTRNERVRIVTHLENLGQPRTRNHGLDLAQGEYIAFLDGDDYCAPKRLARQVDYLDARTDIDGIGTWLAWVDENSRPAARGIRKLPISSNAIACEMLCQCALAQGSMMVRTKAFTKYRYDNGFPITQDYELWARMIRTCRFANLPETLTYYRHHDMQSISTNKGLRRSYYLVIYGRQISSLGVRHDDFDLTRHERLVNFASRESVLERTDAPLDIDYVKWAGTWLEALREGNARARIYPEPDFSHMLTACWLFANRKAVRDSSFWLVARELLKSRLTYWALRHPWQQYKNRKTRRRLNR